MTNKSVPGVPFPKGKSGNPGGRPKENAEVKELAKAYTAQAIERLAHWMQSDNAKASVAAANALLDRGWGKPAQALTGPDGEKLQQPVIYLSYGQPNPPSAPEAG